jgi:hypothetical protein
MIGLLETVSIPRRMPDSDQIYRILEFLLVWVCLKHLKPR